MNFTAPTAGLQAAFDRVAPAINNSATIPILGNVKIDAIDGGGVMLTGTDLEIGVRAIVAQASVTQPGTYTVPAKMLGKTLKASKGTSLDFILDGEQVTINNCRSKFAVTGIAAEAFPELPQLTRQLSTIPAEILAKMIRLTEFATSQEESRFTLNGALFECDGKILMIIATDGSRLALYRAEVSGAIQFKRLVRRDVLKWASTFATTGSITIGDDFVEPPAPAPDEVGPQVQPGNPHHIILQNAASLSEVIGRVLTGTFPDYHRVMPDMEAMLMRITVSRKAMLDALTDILPFLDERSHAIKITPTDGTLRLIGNIAGSVESELTLPILEQTGSAVFAAGWNATYIIDMLKAASDSETVTMHAKTPETAAVWTVDADPEYRYAIMPMRI